MAILLEASGGAGERRVVQPAHHGGGRRLRSSCATRALLGLADVANSFACFAFI